MKFMSLDKKKDKRQVSWGVFFFWWDGMEMVGGMGGGERRWVSGLRRGGEEKRGDGRKEDVG